MPKTYRVAIIGCGRTGRLHAQGYANHPRCEVAALADIDRNRAEALAGAHGFNAAIYTDYGEMLSKEKLDLVSICLWTKMHPSAIRDCVEAGIPAIHCEKPMAPTWGEAQQAAEVAREAGARLTFSHQRRFSPSFRKAKELLHGGEFGELQRIEAFNPANILDWGTHIVDLAFMFNKDCPARWVMGQIDGRQVGRWFDVPFEFAALACVRFENGVRAVIHSGDDKEIGMGIRLTASRGVLELVGECTMRTLRYGEGEWQTEEFAGGPGDQGPAAISAVVKHLVDTLESGAEPELSADGALRATEVIFAIYESSRRRARIDLPLETNDSAFLSMLESGEIAARDEP